MMQLRCTSCVNIMCDAESCKCSCHKLNLDKVKYVQQGNGAVHIE